MAKSSEHDKAKKQREVKKETFNLHHDVDMDTSFCGEEDPGAGLEFLHREDLGEPDLRDPEPH